MSDYVRPGEEGSRATFRFTDDLPRVCVVCGASATGQSSLQLDIPLDPHARAMTLVQMVALVFGFLFFWWRETPGPPDKHWLSLPHCDNHRSVDEIRSAVTVTAVSRYEVEMRGASAKFRQGLESLNAPPSPELLARLDAGPHAAADDYLGDIEKSAVQTPHDYLQNLERETRDG